MRFLEYIVGILMMSICGTWLYGIAIIYFSNTSASVDYLWSALPMAGALAGIFLVNDAMNNANA